MFYVQNPYRQKHYLLLYTLCPGDWIYQQARRALLIAPEKTSTENGRRSRKTFFYKFHDFDRLLIDYLLALRSALQQFIGNTTFE